MNLYPSAISFLHPGRMALRLIAAAVIGGWQAAPALATPEKAAAFYEDALKRFEKDDMPGAIVQLKNALQQDGKMLAAHLLLGKALIKNGQIKAAEAALEEAIKQGVNRSEVALPLGQVYLALGYPSQVIDRIPVAGLPAQLHSEVLTMRGTAYAEAGNLRLAAQSFEEARVADPKNVAPLIAEVPVLLGAGQVNNARTLALKAIGMAPDNANAWNMHASVLHASLDLKAALGAYDRVLAIDPRHKDARVAHAALLLDLNRDSEAATDLDFLKSSALNDPRASYLRAMVAGRKGDFAAVAPALRDVVKLIDGLPPAWLAGREQLLMAGALSHHGLRNFEKAREYLEVVVGRNNRNLAARKLLASICVETNDLRRAQPLLESLQQAIPDDPQVQFLLGSVYMARRRYVQATDLLEKAAARTGSADMSRTLAFSQLGLGQIDQGQASLEKALATNPADDRAGTALAMLYMRRGLPKKALQTADAMVKRDPANLTALNFLGTIHGAAGDKASARGTYAAVLAKDATFRPAALNLVRLDVGDGRYDDGRRRLNEFLARRNDDVDVLYELGLLEQRAGRPAEAVRHFKKANDVQRRDTRPALALIDVQLAQREPDQALETAKALASKFPDNLGVQMALGRTYLAAGDASNARNIFQGMTRLADFDPELQVAIGRLQLSAGNPDGAIYNVQKALQGRPGDPAAMTLQVEVEARRGDAAKADAAYKALLAKHPDLLETILTGANLAMSRGQHAAAVSGFRAALTREESTAIALNLVRAHLAAGESAKALSFLEGWVKRFPSDIPATKALAETQFRAGQLAAARQNYAKALAAEPEDTTTLNNYANLLLKLNDPLAKTAAEKALKLAPNNPSYADTLGWILVNQGQIEPGLRYLREARLRNPGSGELRFHLAYALAKTGRKSEAKEELTAGLSGPGRVQNSDEVLTLKRELGL